MLNPCEEAKPQIKFQLGSPSIHLKHSIAIRQDAKNLLEIPPYVLVDGFTLNCHSAGLNSYFFPDLRNKDVTDYLESAGYADVSNTTLAKISRNLGDTLVVDMRSVTKDGWKNKRHYFISVRNPLPLESASFGEKYNAVRKLQVSCGCPFTRQVEALSVPERHLGFYEHRFVDKPSIHLIDSHISIFFNHSAIAEGTASLGIFGSKEVGKISQKLIKYIKRKKFASYPRAVISGMVRDQLIDYTAIGSFF